MRTQWTIKGNRDAGSSCSCVRELHRYLRNFGGGGLNTPNPPRYATDARWQPVFHISPSLFQYKIWRYTETVHFQLVVRQWQDFEKRCDGRFRSSASLGRLFPAFRRCVFFIFIDNQTKRRTQPRDAASHTRRREIHCKKHLIVPRIVWSCYCF